MNCLTLDIDTLTKQIYPDFVRHFKPLFSVIWRRVQSSTGYVINRPSREFPLNRAIVSFWVSLMSVPNQVNCYIE